MDKLIGALKGTVVGAPAYLLWTTVLSLYPALSPGESFAEWWGYFVNANHTLTMYGAVGAAGLGAVTGICGTVLKQRRLFILLVVAFAGAVLVPSAVMAVGGILDGLFDPSALAEGVVAGFSLSLVYVPLMAPAVFVGTWLVERWTRPGDRSKKISGIKRN